MTTFGLFLAPLFVGVAGILGHFLWKAIKEFLDRKKSPSSVPSFPQISSSQPQNGSSSEERRREEARKTCEREARESTERQRQELEKRSQIVTQILQSGEPDIGRQLARCAGLAHREFLPATDQELVQDIARKVSLPELQVFASAVQSDIAIDVRRREEREFASYPTNDIEPMATANVEQFLSMLPYQFLDDPDTFYAKVAHGEIMVMQSFEAHISEELLYVFLDVSGSMKESLVSGMPRHVFARGLMIRLLTRAISGRAKYFYRAFDGKPHQLLTATTPEEADVLCAKILSISLTDGGTNIPAALQQGVADIKSIGGLVQNAEILLISDGEDEKIGNCDAVRKLLGHDIKLHVALVGKDSDILRAVATSYHHFS